MQTSNKNRLWRVEWNHRSGYQAPSQYVEAKKESEANKYARLKSRLADFPQQWSFRLVEILDEDEN